MIRYIDEPACDHYVDSIKFIENQIKDAIKKSDWDLVANPESLQELNMLVAKMLKEYESYIKFTIEINPYELKIVKTLRESKQFWIDWREENLKNIS